MEHQRIEDILGGGRKGLGPAALRGALRAASWPYGAAMRLRRWAYRGGLLPSASAGAPVISVGNLTVGGTGKTPMVAWIVGRLKRSGRRPAILMRGYRPCPSGAPARAGGAGSDAAARRPGAVSDEAELLRKLTGAPVIVNADRVAGARKAVDQGADVLVLDDGFQHQRLRRDLDIVLIDATRPWGYGYCLPRGLLREPLSALADADAVVLTHSDEAPPDELAGLAALLLRLAPRASVYAAVHRPTKVIDQSDADHPPGALAGRRAFAFCGLAAPGHFFRSAEVLGARLVGRRALEDHVAYDAVLLRELAAEADAAGAEVLLTTEKDHMKIAPLATEPGQLAAWRIWRLGIEIEVVSGGEELSARIVDAARGPAGA